VFVFFVFSVIGVQVCRKRALFRAKEPYLQQTSLI